MNPFRIYFACLSLHFSITHLHDYFCIFISYYGRWEFSSLIIPEKHTHTHTSPTNFASLILLKYLYHNIWGYQNEEVNFIHSWAIQFWRGRGEIVSASSSKFFSFATIFSDFQKLCFMSCCFSVSKSCSTLCEPMDCSIPGFPVLHHLPELAQPHVHWVGDDIQPHPLLSSSPPTSVFPSIWVFSSKSALYIRWPKY